MTRRPQNVVRAIPALGGAGRRVIGTTDPRGQGTTHALAEVGPFLLLDDGRGIDGPGRPTFGAHPHAGLVAVSYPTVGGRWRSTCNWPGAEEDFFAPGQILVTHAGRGAVHDEVTASDGLHDLTQIILRLPASHRDTPASVTAHEVTDLGGGVTRVLDAEALRPTGLDAVLYHCRLAPGGAVTLPVAPAHTAGFVFVRRGALRAGGTSLTEDDVGVLGPEGDTLTLAHEGDAPADAIVGLGAPLPEPWVKLLGHDGFVVAGTLEEADALLADYARERARFGLD